MNKLAGIFYLQEREIKTSADGLILIPRENIEKTINKTRINLSRGLCVRCGEEPSRDAKPDVGLPWAVCSTKEEAIQSVRAFYRDIGHARRVFIYPQVDMEKSGNMMISGDFVLIEAVSGWPEALTHGRKKPDAIYQYKLGMLVEPRKVEGNYGLLNPLELYRVTRVERAVELQDISIEFSLSRGVVTFHDIINLQNRN